MVCVHLRLLEVYQDGEFLGREIVVVYPCVILPSGQCQKRPNSVKRDLVQCQKRPSTVSKET
jgi:hypothetical protein